MTVGMLLTSTAFRAPRDHVGALGARRSALDCAMPQLLHPTKGEVERAMKGHVLAEAQLVGTYAR